MRSPICIFPFPPNAYSPEQLTSPKPADSIAVLEIFQAQG